mgnify:CR=1 FL=1
MDIVVAGAGSWGTALGCVLSQNQHRVTLWGRDAEQVAEMTDRRENRRYLPGVKLPAGLRFTSDLGAALRALPTDASSMLVAVARLMACGSACCRIHPPLCGAPINHSRCDTLLLLRAHH